MPRTLHPYHLISYLQNKNRMRSFQKQSELLVPYTEQDAKPIIQMMDEDLEPELLSQDGERSHREQQDAVNNVLRAKVDLEHILGRKIELDNW